MPTKFDYNGARSHSFHEKRVGFKLCGNGKGNNLIFVRGGQFISGIESYINVPLLFV